MSENNRPDLDDQIHWKTPHYQAVLGSWFLMRTPYALACRSQQSKFFRCAPTFLAYQAAANATHGILPSLLWVYRHDLSRPRHGFHRQNLLLRLHTVQSPLGDCGFRLSSRYQSALGENRMLNDCCRCLVADKNAVLHALLPPRHCLYRQIRYRWDFARRYF